MTLDDIAGRATISIPEVAELFSIGRSAAYSAARAGQIPTIKLGRRLRVPVPKLLAMLGVEEDGQALADGPSAQVSEHREGNPPSGVAHE